MPRAQIKKTEGDRRQLPEHEEGDEVAGIGRADGRAGIDQGRHMLQRVGDLESVEHADGGGGEEDDAEDVGQPVDPERRQLEAEKRHLPIGARLQSEDDGEADQRQRQHVGAAHPVAQEAEPAARRESESGRG